MRVFDDNPADLDLLGFDAVVAPVVGAIQRADTRPLTIGIRGGWGTGKSTLLGLVGASFAASPESTNAEGSDRKLPYLILRVDPWEFENAGELRSTLVEMVLSELKQRLGKTEQVGKQLRRLIARVRFGKIAQAALKGLTTMPLDGGLGMVGQLVKGMSGDTDSFVADSDEEVLPATMHGFRAEFSALIRSVHQHNGVEKIVVLVDDLDRCLPNAVVEILEAIKLFLSVDRMVFVIAADEGLVRSAISISLLGRGRASDFSDMYLEKIVQLPLTIPVLAADDAVTYATLLLCSDLPGAYETLRAHCSDRRKKGLVPLLDGAPQTVDTSANELLARQICDGLKADRLVNPRQIKRFLNAFMVRSAIAAARGMGLRPAVVAKLMLLEEQYVDTDFKTLASTPPTEVQPLLASWEAWAIRDGGGTPPDGITEASRRWASAGPRLASVEDDIPAYLRLAATLTATPSAGHLSSRVVRVIDGIIASQSEEGARRAFIAEQVRSLDQLEIEQLIVGLAQRAPTLSPPAFAIRAVVEVTDASPSAAPHAAKAIVERLWPNMDLRVAALVAMSRHPAIQQVAQALAIDDRMDAKVRKGLANAIKKR